MRDDDLRERHTVRKTADTSQDRKGNLINYTVCVSGLKKSLLYIGHILMWLCSSSQIHKMFFQALGKLVYSSRCIVSSVGKTTCPLMLRHSWKIQLYTADLLYQQENK